MVLEKTNENKMLNRIRDLEKKNHRLGRIVSKQKQVIKNLESILHTTPEVAFQYIDLDGTVIRWNQTSQQLYGYQEEEVIGRRIQDVLVTGPAAKEFSDGLKKACDTGSPTPTVGWHISKSGGGSVFVRACAIPILDEGKPLAFCTMQIDATDTKRVEDLLMNFNQTLEKRVRESTGDLKNMNRQLQAEVAERQRFQEALQASKQRFRIFTDYSYAWEYWIGPDRKMIHVTPSCERITGYRPEAFMENENLLTMIVHPEDQPKLAGPITGDINTRGPSVFDFRILTRDGRLRWISHTCQPVFSDDKRFIGRRASNLDVTEQRWAEAELQAAKNELEIRVEKRTAELQSATGRLASKQAELSEQRTNLASLNQELLETNKAVSILAKALERKKADSENRVTTTITAKIMPIVDRLRHDPDFTNRHPELDVMAAYLREMTSHMGRSVQVISILSEAEARIAALMRNGLRTKEIAARLNISSLTVKTHRRNIRKKLGLQNTKENLVSFLKSYLAG